MNTDTQRKSIRKKAQVNKDFCVACGACAKVCPKNAIKIMKGVFAEVDKNQCVGCLKCVNICPASTIEIITVEEVQ